MLYLLVTLFLLYFYFTLFCRLSNLSLVNVVRKMLNHLYMGDHSESLNESPAYDSPTRQPLLISVLQIYARLFALAINTVYLSFATLPRQNVSRLKNNLDPGEFLDSIPDVF